MNVGNNSFNNKVTSERQNKFGVSEDGSVSDYLILLKYFDTF